MSSSATTRPRGRHLIPVQDTPRDAGPTAERRLALGAVVLDELGAQLRHLETHPARLGDPQAWQRRVDEVTRALEGVRRELAALTPLPDDAASQAVAVATPLDAAVRESDVALIQAMLNGERR